MTQTMNEADKTHRSPLLSAQNITVRRDKNLILDNVSLEVGQRDFVTIIGPNGAGKSMLLKCLLQFYTPDSGEIIHKSGLKIGYVPQRLTPEASLPISVKRFLKLRQSKNSQDLTTVMRDTDVLAFADTQLSVLSGGEMQRVLLARALLNSPDLLVLDEPAQNLDIGGQLAFYKRLKLAFESRNISVLMVSHDLHLVLSSTQQVICLYQHVCCSGEPATVTQDPEFINLFGQDMADMMAVYRHDHDHHHSSDPLAASSCSHSHPIDTASEAR